jgi:hypothetical protein
MGKGWREFVEECVKHAVERGTPAHVLRKHIQKKVKPERVAAALEMFESLMKADPVIDFDRMSDNEGAPAEDPESDGEQPPLDADEQALMAGRLDSSELVRKRIDEQDLRRRGCRRLSRGSQEEAGFQAARRKMTEQLILSRKATLAEVNAELSETPSTTKQHAKLIDLRNRLRREVQLRERELKDGL